MAKAWAKGFYNSKAWKDTRLSYIKDVHGLCERCTDLAPGYIVHHKVELTQYNITDPSITLNKNNLEYLCKPCHDKEHGVGAKAEVVSDGLFFDEEGNLRSIM